MHDSLGSVKYNERTLHDRLSRDVDEKMRHWLRERRLDEGPSGYEVSFFDEDILEEVSCLIMVQARNRRWRSWETAPNARQAFILSIERLRLSEQERHGTNIGEESVNGQQGGAGQRPAAAEQGYGPIHR